MNKIADSLRDWFRGYSDQDIFTALSKVNDAQSTPGKFVMLSNREYKAFTKHSYMNAVDCDQDLWEAK